MARRHRQICSQTMRNLLSNLSRPLLALIFVAGGLNHFRAPDVYESIIPPYLPNPRLLNLVSGVAEILGGIGVLIPQTRRAAGIGLILLLVAIFPANVYMATNRADLPERLRDLPQWTLWLRLPLQGLLIFWVWRATSQAKTNGGDAAKPTLPPSG